MKKISYFACRFVVIAILLVTSSNISAAAEEKVTVPTEEQKTTFIDLYSWASILPKELIDLHNRIAKDKKIKSIEGNIPQLENHVNFL